MKITPQILEKYAQGKCSETEIEFVEQWLDAPQDGEAEKNAHLFTDAQQQQVWKKLQASIFSKKSLISISRYAAAACFVGAVFLAGRQSAMANSALFTQQQTKIEEINNLLVYGGNGAYAKIPGNEFSLQFNGKLKFYNGSRDIKIVKSGHKTYTLQPMQTYVLIGNNQNSTLIGIDLETEQNAFNELKGDFSIKILKQ